MNSYKKTQGIALSFFCLFKFLVVVMSIVITLSFAEHFLIKSVLQIDTGLVSQTKYYKHYIGEFFT